MNINDEPQDGTSGVILAALEHRNLGYDPVTYNPNSPRGVLYRSIVGDESNNNLKRTPPQRSETVQLAALQFEMKRSAIGVMYKLKTLVRR